MTRQIRFGMFESNSSTTHVLYMVSRDAYEKYEAFFREGCHARSRLRYTLRIRLRGARRARFLLRRVKLLQCSYVFRILSSFYLCKIVYHLSGNDQSDNRRNKRAASGSLLDIAAVFVSVIGESIR